MSSTTLPEQMMVISFLTGLGGGVQHGIQKAGRFVESSMVVVIFERVVMHPHSYHAAARVVDMAEIYKRN